MKFLFIDPMNTDMVFSKEPQLCWMVVMSTRKFKSRDLTGCFDTAIQGYLCESANGYKVAFDKKGYELVASIADDPYVIAAYSTLEALRDFIYSFLDSQKTEVMH